MIPIELQCGCGQRYAFDAEPVDGQMGVAIACPTCGLDGTEAANQVISQALAAQATPPPSAMKLRMAPAPAVAEPVGRAEVITDLTPPPPPVKKTVKQAEFISDDEFSLRRGIAGALIGALVGSGAMYGFFLLVGFRFPLLGVGIGALTGYVAKKMARLSDSQLGIISGVIALIAVVGTLYLMYGEFPILSIISAVVSVSVAYRIASE
jgi:hypothetical protein